LKPIKTGIIGFGRMASNHHLTAMRETELYDIVAVCDITESRRAAAVEEGLTATDDLDAFLDSDLELVLITTHSSLHYETALKVATAKKHMLIEKPLAVHGPDAEEMVQAAADHGVTLTVYHNRHYDGDYRLVKSAVRDGLIGDIITLENRTMGSSPAVGFGVPEYNQQWRITAAAGGGTMLDFGPHWVEQVLDLMEGQRVVSVFADVRNLKWGDAEDLFDITMVFDNDARARASKADVSYCTLPYKWVVLGTEASLTCEDGGSKHCTIHGPEYEMKRTKSVEAIDLHVNIAEHLREGKALIIPASHALRVMQVLEAARQSGASGKSIDVNI
jgi:scyllo-inositol 2-dehydrogenase (NADP+)